MAVVFEIEKVKNNVFVVAVVVMMNGIQEVAVVVSGTDPEDKFYP